MDFKNYYNYGLNFVLFYASAAIVISSYMLWFVLPMARGLYDDYYCEARFTGEGSHGNQWLVFGWPRYVWVDVHSWIGVVLAILIVVHLILHWRWLAETTEKLKNYVLNGQKAALERYITSFITLLTMAAFQLFSGVVVWLIMPRGYGDFLFMKAGLGRTFWGLQRNEWLDLHAWVAVAMVAIVIIHIIMHWRWIVNMTLGKLLSGKTGRKLRLNQIKAADYPYTGNEIGQENYLLRAGLFTGLLGSICFLVLMGVYQLDWVGRYGFMLYLIPLPFISLLIAWKWKLIGGILILFSGIAAVMLDINYNVGVSYHVVGIGDPKGIGYTLSFVAIPLVISGFLYIISAIKNRKVKVA